MRHLFPELVSYNRFVELEREVAVPLALFIKKVLLGKCTGISFVDSTPLRVCKNQRIHILTGCKGKSILNEKPPPKRGQSSLTQVIRIESNGRIYYVEK